MAEDLVLNWKRRRVRLPVEEQLEIVRRFESGERPAHIAKETGLR